MVRVVLHLLTITAVYCTLVFLWEGRLAYKNF